MFVGRGATYPVALEGALKLKEVSYVHAEGYAAGELKHGPISLLDAECPLVAVATRSPVYDKLISNVMEGRARDARVIAVATEGDEQIERLRRRRLLGPRHPRGAQPGPGDHPAPAVRLSHRGRPGHGRRPATQPGQVGHGRVATPMADGLVPGRDDRARDRHHQGRSDPGLPRAVRAAVHEAGPDRGGAALRPRPARDDGRALGGQGGGQQGPRARRPRHRLARHRDRADADRPARGPAPRPGRGSRRAARDGADRGLDHATNPTTRWRSRSGSGPPAAAISSRPTSRSASTSASGCILARIERLRATAEAGGAAALASDAPPAATRGTTRA